jgi:hypothetical protein
VESTTSAPSTALRREVRQQLSKIESADLILGIPAYQSESTIGHVVETLSSGVKSVYPNKEIVLLVSDGGSLDDTRENAIDADTPEDVPVLINIYRGLAGKGTALRSIFEAGELLDVSGGMVVDSDMRQWPAEWSRRHLSPVLDESMDLMTPRYRRHKFDATITNSVCFPMTNILYGHWVRQPIGGDFALSGDLMSFYANRDEWGTDVARFGIDIWMTTTALCEGFQVGQTNLGAKIHDPKDPGDALGPMFREVVGTLFRLAGRYSERWIDVTMIEDVPTYHDPIDADPDYVPVNRPGLRDRAVLGWQKHRERISNYLNSTTFGVIEETMDALAQKESILSFLTPKIWIHVLYDYLVAYNRPDLDNRAIMDSLIPLYFARTWSLYHEMDPLDTEEAETYIQQLVEDFAGEKQYLRDRWRQVHS